MLGFNHVLTGSIIAIIAPTPLVPAVAFVSHFILDMTPHFGRSTTVTPYTKQFIRLLIFDAILCFLALGFALVLFPDRWFIIVIGAFFSALPDFFWLLRRRASRRFDRFLDWAEWIQWGERPYGWLFDAFYGLVMILVLVLLAGR
jgi:hypothetical protein